MKFNNITIYREDMEEQDLAEGDFRKEEGLNERLSDEFKLPQKAPVTLNFNDEQRIGTATNFDYDNGKIKADIEIDDDQELDLDQVAAVPSFIAEIDEDGTSILKETAKIGVTNHPLDKTLQGNLNK